MQPERSILDILRRRAETEGGRRAFLALPEGAGPGTAWTYGELLDRAARVAGSLGRRAGRGDRVLLLLPDGLEFLQAFFGCLLAGCIPVPLPAPQNRRHLDRIRRVQLSCQASAAIVAAADGASGGDADDPAAGAAAGVAMPCLTLRDLDDGAPAAGAGADAGGIAFLQYTSGSTGDPKGAIVTHAGILANQRAIERCFAHDRDSVVVGWLPLFHDMGLIGNVLQSIYCGIPCVLLPTARVLQNPLLWLRAITEHRGTTSGGPDFMYALCARRVRPEDRTGLDLASWKVAFNGSEPIRAETLAAFVEAFAPCGFHDRAFLPCYGLAEATLLVTGRAAGSGVRVAWADRHEIERGVFHARAPQAQAAAPYVSCGTPWEDTRIAIVDPESGARLPDGRVGEVAVEGEGVVPGYWGARGASPGIREDAARGQRTLRTGDLGFVDGGDLFVIGRVKDTLVVRGRNIHAADVEAVAQTAHPRLAGRRAAAFAAADDSIVVVHEAARGDDADGLATCRALEGRLAEEFGVAPDAILLVRPGTIPVTTSGKVQRRACRAQVAAGELPAWYTWRRAVGEEDVAGALAAALADPEHALDRLRERLRRPIDRSTTIPALGLDSVQMLRLAHEIETRTGARLPWSFLAGATVEELARAIAASASPTAPRPDAARRPDDDGQPAPLAPGQLALWYLHLVAPDNPCWHLARSLRIEGRVGRHALAQAIRLLLLRHPALCARVAHAIGTWIQAYPPPDGRPLALAIDARSVDEPALARALAAAALRPFVPERGGLFRALSFERPGAAILQLAVHHLAADLWSVGILLRELLEAHARFGAGLPAALPPVRGRYAAFARRQSRADAPGYRHAREHWESLLASRAGGVWPEHASAPVTRAGLRASARTWVVPADLAARVRRAARAEGHSAFTILLTAFQALVGRLAAGPRVVIGTVVSGRAEAEFSGVVGCFAKAVPVGVDLSGDPPFRALVRHVGEAVRDALTHQDFPIESLYGQAAGTGTPRAPFDTVFVYQGASADLPGLMGSLAVGAEGEAEEVSGLRVRPLRSSHAVPQFPLVVTVTERRDEYLVHVSACDGGPWRDAAGTLGDHLVALLRDALEHPDAHVSRLECWPASERALLGPGPVPWPSGRTLHDDFRDVASHVPDRVAVSADQHLTYACLDRESDRLAACLPAGEPVVGVYVGRTAGVCVAILGVLKAGAAYLPIATTWPAPYAERVLRAAGVAVVVTSRADEAGLPEVFRRVYVDALPRAAPAARAAAPADERSPAYLIHTSGSTGEPKAVSVSHGHVLRLLAAARREFDFTAEDVWTLFHATSFDFSVWEIWGALAQGARLEIPSREVCRDPAAFHAFLVARQVTVLNQTPTAFAWLQRHLTAGGAGALRYVIFGGEKLDFRLLVPSFAEEQPRPAFVNMYGITETTVHVTVHRIARDEVMDGAMSHIGRPLADLRAHVLNASMRPAPAGAAGELYVGGAGVTNGYWRRPDATAERFVPDPFTTVPGSRLYRTGDLARLRPDGRLAFVGRRDRQVKVRGHRLELGAIESALLRHAAVGQVAVLFQPPPERRSILRLEGGAGQRAGESGGPPMRELLSRTEQEAADAGRICAFVVRGQGSAGDASSLRDFAARVLPDYMIPSRWVFLERLPRTVNGKVDARALLALVSDRPSPAQTFVAPRSDLEATLAGIWAEALGAGVVGIDDNLFELGGDSIRSLRIVGRARERGIGVTLAQLLEAQTVRALAALVEADEASGGADAPAAPAVVRLPDVARPGRAAREGAAAAAAGVEDAYPLARLQEGLLYHCALDADPSLYRDVFLYHFRMPLDAGALEESLAQVTRRHPALRTSFDLDSFAEPMQLVHAAVRPSFEVVRDWPCLDVDRSRALLRWAETERHRPLRMDCPPPIRFFALEDGADSFHLTLSFHDALLDGWSASLLLGEIVQRYQHALAGTALPLEPMPAVTFAQFVAAEREELGRAEAREFWRAALEGIRPCLVGGDAARGPLEVARVPISPDESARLIALARTLKTPLKSVLLAVHVRVLASWTSRERIVTGLESNGRLEVTGADETLGLHLNTLPLTLAPGRGSWADLAAAAFARERAIWPFRRFPLSEIRKSGPRGEIFDSVFNYTHFHHLRRLEALSNVHVLGARGLGSTHYALRAEFNRDPFRDLVQLDLELDTARVPAAERAALVASYAEAIREVVAGGRAARAHHHVSAASPGDGRALAGPALAPGAAAAVRNAFDALAREQPDAVALACERGSITYRGLDRAADAVAGALAALGLGRGDRVGICLEDPAGAIAVMVAAMKLRCAYVPLDPRAQPERIGMLSGEARLGCLVVDGARAGAFPAGRAAAVLALGPDLLRGDGRPPLAAEAPGSDDVVYVIFTSGSTGSPKGVAVTNRGLAASLAARHVQYPEAPERFLLLSPLFFDSSVAVVFGALARGGAVVLPPAGVVREPGSIADWILRRQVTHVLALPWVYAALLDAAPPHALATLRRVIVAGEPCQPAHVRRHFRVLPGVELTNEYGPTESTVWSTAFECREYRGQTSVPIGRPIAGMTVRLLAPDLRPARPGGDGEIHLSGPALAAGYLGRPDLTAASFIPDPFAPAAGGRMYRTGDRARVLATGDLEFLGRRDRQLKIRGHRVEPSEIEAVLLAHPGVVDARVSFEPATRQLVSFVTPRPGIALEPGEIRRHAARWLPEYMRPRQFHIVPSLPRTPAGKLDASRLSSAAERAGSAAGAVEQRAGT